MPNTLAHFAVSGLLTRAVIKESDVKWIYTASVVPDLPWILQRLLNVVPHTFVAYDVRAYAIAQSSLLVCLFFGLGVSCIFPSMRKMMAIFSLGALVHLLLDATQIKLANGVLLFVPFDWQLMRFDLFWPESIWTYLLTFSGLVYFVFHARQSLKPVSLKLSCRPVLWGAGLLAFALWLSLPLVFSAWVYDNDNHFIQTLSDVTEREGKVVELDRVQLATNAAQLPEGTVVLTAFGERINLDQSLGLPGDTVSLRGVFTEVSTIKVLEYRSHINFRDTASMVGLLLVLLTWLACGLRWLLTRASEVAH